MDLPAFVQHNAGDEGGGWYGVYVGPFEDMAKARQTDLALRAATGASPVLRERVSKETRMPEPYGVVEIPR